MFLNLGVAPDDLSFARQEARRCKMDVASVLIAYGMISANDLLPADGAKHLTCPIFAAKRLQRAAAVCASFRRSANLPARAAYRQAGTRPVSGYAAVLPSGMRAEQHEPGGNMPSQHSPPASDLGHRAQKGLPPAFV